MDTAATSLRANSSYTASCTNIRLAHTQVCPELRNLLAMAPSTAASRSASSNTMNGALPPSSSDTRLMPSAHCAISFLPTAVEPVKLSLRTAGCEVISAPIAEALEPVTMLTTPAGTPARCASTARASAEYGVCSAGLHTTVQPAARAGASLRPSMAEGKFHGVIVATTPTGWRSTTIRLSAACPGITSPYMRRASSANHST